MIASWSCVLSWTMWTVHASSICCTTLFAMTEKKLECPYCGVPCASADSRRVHIVRQHPNVKKVLVQRYVHFTVDEAVEKLCDTQTLQEVGSLKRFLHPVPKKPNCLHYGSCKARSGAAQAQSCDRKIARGTRKFGEESSLCWTSNICWKVRKQLPS